MSNDLYTASHWGTYRFTGSDLAPVDDDPDPSVVGRGWWSAVNHAPSRVARPSIRKGWLKSRDRNRSGDAEFVELPWDEALDIAAQEFQRVIKEHGNTAIYGGSYGWSSAGRFHHAQSQLRRFLNCIGGCVDKRNTYSHAGAEVLFPHVFGLNFYQTMSQATTWDQIAQNAQLVVAFGGLTPRTSQVASGGVAYHHVADDVAKVKASGARMLNISPVGSDMEGGEWLSIRPGSDRALMLALAYVLFDEGLADLDFLSRCTQGHEIWRDQVMGAADGIAKTPAWAAPICDIPAETITQLARDMAKHKTLITVAYGLQRACRGEETLWAAINLACTLGQIGQPGTGFAFGPASMNSTSRPVTTRSWPSLPTGKRPIPDFIPVARITEMLENPGGTFLYEGETHSYPDIKLIAWGGGNPFHHHQDLMRLERAWQKPDTVIVAEHSWTATARRSDIVFPATSPVEREDIMMQYREDRLIYMSQLRARHGEARNDYDIWTGVTQRMGLGDAFTEGKSADQWLQQFWEDARQTDPELPDFETFKRVGKVTASGKAAPHVFLQDFVKSPSAAPLPTQSGKINVANDHIGSMNLPDLGITPSWTAPKEWLGDAPPDALHLISPQPNHRLHAQNDAGDAVQAIKVQGREPCVLHPETAASKGLKAGDVALLSNERGRCLVGVSLDMNLRRDCVVLPTGAWLDIVQLDDGPLDVHGNPNVLTYDAGTTTLSQGNSAHTALVYLSKWDRDVPPVTVHNGPVFVPAK